jgi:hypothetical protein
MSTVAPSSFARFVYPFIFDPTTSDVRARAADGARWPGRERPLQVWREAAFPEEDLLPHVARYLNPPAGTPPTARLWEVNDDALQSPRGLGAGESVQWALRWRDREIPFRLEGAELALFGVGVGLLTVQARPLPGQLADWLDYLYAFRFARGQREVGIRLQRRVSADDYQPYFPAVAGGRETHPEGTGILGEVLDALLQTAAVNGDTGRWWREIFVPGQLLPYAAVYVDDVREDEVAPLLYRIRNFFPSQREIRPAAEDLRLDHDAHLTYADRQYFLFSLEGAAFLAFDAPKTDFFRRELPAHLRTHYFLLYLVALHQRLALTRLSEAVSEHWLGQAEVEREKAFEHIEDRLLTFTARGYFTQVMQRAHHHRVYRRWQEVFQLEQLYREVSDEIREMHNLLLVRRSQLEEAATRRLERLVGLLGTIIGVPALVLAFLDINLKGVTTAQEGLPLRRALFIAALALVLGILMGLLLSFLVQRSVQRRGK